MNELNWIAEARKYIGLCEIKGHQHNPVIQQWLKDMGSFNQENKAWWEDDETPWCGLFVAHCLGKTNRFVIKEWFRAQAWARDDLMTQLNQPAYGCIAVLTRTGGGHVGFVVGKNSQNQLLLLGGNQSNQVCIAAFSTHRVTAYYWPSFNQYNKPVKSVPLQSRYQLPIVQT